MLSRFSRRGFISLISFTIAGATVAGSFPSLKNLFISKAQAQEISEKVYKGRKFKVITNPELQRRVNADNIFDASKQLFVDDKEIKILQHRKTNRYLTPLLFGDFEKPEDIAKTLIDLKLKFPNREVEIDPNLD